MQNNKKPKLFLIDGNHLLNRNFHIPRFKDLGVVIDGQMIHTGGAFGFLNSIRKIKDDKCDESSEMIVTWDAGGRNFRKDIDSTYKENREKSSQEFVNQYDIARDFMRSLGVTQCWERNEEADDIIGIMATKAAAHGWYCIIISGDKDFYQLVSEDIHVLRPKQGDIEELLVTPEVVYQRFGVTPAQFVEYKALIGDGSDNISGVKGIGPKAAAAIVNAHETIENVIESEKTFKMKDGVRVALNKSAQALIDENKSKLAIYKKLSMIKREADFELNVRRSSFDSSLFKELCTMFEFKETLNNFNSFCRSFT